MVRTLHALTLLLALALFVLLRVPYAVRVGGAVAKPEAATAALAVMARPAGTGVLDALDPSRPILPPLLLTGVYDGLVATGLAGEGVRDGAGFVAQASSGGAAAMRGGAIAWIAIEALLLVALGVLARRLAGRLALPPWTAAFAVLLFVVAPLALTGARRFDAAMLALPIALAGVLIALLRPAPGDPWRWLAGGVLIGVAAAAHPVGLVLLPFLALAFVTHAPGGAAVRIAVAGVGVLVGCLLGDPRLVDAPALLLLRFETAAFAAPTLGHVSGIERLLRGLTPVPVLLALVGIVGAWGRGREGRAVACALGVPLVVVPFLPATGLSSALLVAPCAAMLAAVGIGVLAEGRARHVGLALAVAAVVWPAASSIGETTKVQRGESRDAAAEWLRAHLPEDASIVTDFYGPELPSGHVVFTLPFDAERPDVYAGAYELGWYDGFDTFVIVSTQEARYRLDPERYPTQLAFLDRLRATCEEVARFDRREYAGPTITIYRRRGTPSGSELSRLLRRLPVEPPVPDFYLTLGGAYERLGRIDDAKRFLTIAAHLVPGDPRLAVNLSGIYIREGSYMRADSLLQLAVHASPTNAKLRYQAGLVKQERKLFGDAIGEYKMAVRYDPTYAEAFFNLAICYFEVGNYAGARNAFRRVTELAGEGRLRSEAVRMIEELDAQ